MPVFCNYFPDADKKVRCFLCDRSFSAYPESDDVDILIHMYISHSITICDISRVADLQAYLAYYHQRYREASSTLKSKYYRIITFPIQHSTLGEQMRKIFVLGNSCVEDEMLRRTLHSRKLEQAQIEQADDLSDLKYQKHCFYCHGALEVSRVQFVNHLRSHGFQLGNPYKMVYITDFINSIENTFLSGRCLFCNVTFGTCAKLVKHMEKYGHKKIHPKDLFYDQFYMVNYVEYGKTWKDFMKQKEMLTEKLNDNDPIEKLDDDDWSSWGSEPINILCLFCDHICHTWEGTLLHMAVMHSFDFHSNISRLQFYRQVKAVNYIRRQVSLQKCIYCREQFETNYHLSAHMDQFKHTFLPDFKLWDQRMYFFPVLDDDSLLYHLVDNEDENEVPSSLVVVKSSNIMPADIKKNKKVKFDHPLDATNKVETRTLLASDVENIGKMLIINNGSSGDFGIASSGNGEKTDNVQRDLISKNNDGALENEIKKHASGDIVKNGSEFKSGDSAIYSDDSKRIIDDDDDVNEHYWGFVANKNLSSSTALSSSSDSSCSYPCINIYDSSYESFHKGISDSPLSSSEVGSSVYNSSITNGNDSSVTNGNDSSKTSGTEPKMGSNVDNSSSSTTIYVDCSLFTNSGSLIPNVDDSSILDQNVTRITRGNSSLITNGNDSLITSETEPKMKSNGYNSSSSSIPNVSVSSITDQTDSLITIENSSAITNGSESSITSRNDSVMFSNLYNSSSSTTIFDFSLFADSYSQITNGSDSWITIGNDSSITNGNDSSITNGNDTSITNGNDSGQFADSEATNSE